MTNPTKLLTDVGKIYCKYCRFPVENEENADNDQKYGVHSSCIAEIKIYLEDQIDLTQ